MVKAFRDEAVVNLLRVSNNTGYGSLRLAQGVKSSQIICLVFTGTICLQTRLLRISSNAMTLFHCSLG